MYSDKNLRFHRRLAFRLSLWYGGVLTLAAALCFGIFYTVMVSAMRDRTDSYLMAQARRSAELLHTDGLPAAAQELSIETGAAGTSDLFFRIVDRDGKPTASSDLSSWREVEITKRPVRAPAGEAPQFETWAGTGRHENVRVLTMPLDGGPILQLGTTMDNDVRVMRESRRIVSLVMIGIVLLAVLTGWLIARRALSGVEHLTHAARDIARGKLDSRVSVAGRRDEVDQLAITFNGMVDRIQALVESMRETNDNIAHELRSPITRMRGLAETTLVREAGGEDYRELASTTVEECDRLLGIINTMLDIAEAEARAVLWPMDSVDISAVLRDACELYEPVADQRNITFHVQSDGECLVAGSIQQLQRAVANLIDNAVKYSPPGAAIEVRAARVEAGVTVTIRNPGPGIPPEDLPHVFDRFYRGKENRQAPGSGLGLSLSQAIIRAHGGTITVVSEPGRYTEFRISLPAAS